MVFERFNVGYVTNVRLLSGSEAVSFLVDTDPETILAAEAGVFDWSSRCLISPHKLMPAYQYG